MIRPIKLTIVKLLTFSLLALGLAASHSAQASVDTLELDFVGLANVSIPRVTSNGVNPGYTGGTMFGGGVLASFPFFPGFRLESGVLYVPEFYSYSFNNTAFNELQVPVLVRFTLLPFLSVGAGGFLGFGIGNVTNNNTSVANSITTSYSFDQKSLSNFDFGAEISAEVDLPLTPNWSLMLDARYLLGLRDIDTSVAQSIYTGGLMILAGVKYSL